jgi:Sec7-like guanine-nucleotide exchange factor
MMGGGPALSEALLKGMTTAVPLEGHLTKVGFRNFLVTFRLSGEATQIDQVITRWSREWFQQNAHDPTICPFANEDVVFCLCYSIIMLNTDLHNPNVTDKMPQINFVRSNRGINDTGDLPEGFLEGIFDDIECNQLILQGVDKMNAAEVDLPPVSNASTWCRKSALSCMIS